MLQIKPDRLAIDDFADQPIALCGKALRADMSGALYWPAEKALIHHSDRGSQYLSIRYSERLAEAGIEPSVGSVGDSYDNAMAESVIGLFKTEVTKRRSWRSRDEVEWETLSWVDWYNNQRLLGPIGNIPPAEAEAAYYAGNTGHAMAA